MKYVFVPHHLVPLASAIVIAVVIQSPLLLAAKDVQKVEVNCIADIACVSEITYKNPFIDVELDAIITGPDGVQFRVPAFWDGGDRWRFRYAACVPGAYVWKLDCSDASNSKLHGITGRIEVVPYRGENVLLRQRRGGTYVWHGRGLAC